MASKGSKRFNLDKQDLYKILTVLGWTVAASAIVALTDLNAVVEYPTEWLFLQPMVNTALYSASKFIKENK